MSVATRIFVRVAVVFLLLSLALLFTAAAVNYKHHALQDEDDDASALHDRALSADLYLS